EMKKINLLIIIFILGVLPVSAQEITMENIYEGIEFRMNRFSAPEFPDYSVKITDYGAVDGGLDKNTSAITRAIDDVYEKGGGKVIIPRGIWLTGPIELKS